MKHTYDKEKKKEYNRNAGTFVWLTFCIVAPYLHPLVYPLHMKRKKKITFVIIFGRILDIIDKVKLH